MINTTLLKYQKCTLCDYETNYSSLMDKHVKKFHSIERNNKEYISNLNHKCSYCQYTTDDIYKISEHLKIHTNDNKNKKYIKKFKCKFCNFTDNKVGSIKRHISKEHKKLCKK